MSFFFQFIRRWDLRKLSGTRWQIDNKYMLLGQRIQTLHGFSLKYDILVVLNECHTSSHCFMCKIKPLTYVKRIWWASCSWKWQICIFRKCIFTLNNSKCGVLFSSRLRDLVLIAFGFFAVPHWRQLPPSGTHFSSAHAYKVEGGGSCLRCGTAKKPKTTRTKSLGLELKIYTLNIKRTSWNFISY